LATNRLSFTGSLGLLDATFGDFPGGLSTETTVTINAAGNTLRYAPRISATIGIQYYIRAPIVAADILFQLDIMHTDDYYTSTANESSQTLDGAHPAVFIYDPTSLLVSHTVNYGHVNSLTTLNGRIGLISDSSVWNAYLWGKNLSNKNNIINYGLGFAGTLLASSMEPRSYGLELSYHF